MHERDFSYTHYEKTLKEISKTHRFANFLDCSYNDVILRHDVDFSLESALRMAKLENELEIRSTFFILFDANLYNPFATKSSDIIKEILQLGHYLGLHYDTSFMNQNTNPNEMISKEIEMMQHNFNAKITAIAMHNPTINEKIVIDLPKDIADADSDEFKTNRKYISDSVQHWREGCFCNHINNKQMHILIHPIWWTEGNMKREDILESISRGELSDHKKELEEISKMHRDYLSRIK